MRIFFRWFLGSLLLLQLQGCYTKLLIPQRREEQTAKTISPSERAIQELFERPFNPDMELIGSRWESRTWMVDAGTTIDRISFGQNDQLAYSPNSSPRYGVARYRIFSDTLIVVFENAVHIDKYLYRIQGDRLQLNILGRSNNEGMSLVGWSSGAVFDRITR